MRTKPRLEAHGEICDTDPCETCERAFNIEKGLAAVAQAAINVAEGHTTIEAGSQLHRGWELLCKALVQNEITAQEIAVVREALKVLRALVDAERQRLHGERTHVPAELWRAAEAALAKAIEQ